MHVLHFGTNLNLLHRKPLQGTAGAEPRAEDEPGARMSREGAGTRAGAGTRGRDSGRGPGRAAAAAALPEAAARASPRSGSAAPPHSEPCIFGVLTFIHPLTWSTNRHNTYSVSKSYNLVTYCSEGQVFSWIFIIRTIMFLLQKYY